MKLSSSFAIEDFTFSYSELRSFLTSLSPDWNDGAGRGLCKFDMLEGWLILFPWFESILSAIIMPVFTSGLGFTFVNVFLFFSSSSLVSDSTSLNK